MRARATGPESGELLLAEDETLVATVKLTEGKWTVERKLNAEGPNRALPQSRTG